MTSYSLDICFDGSVQESSGSKVGAAYGWTKQGVPPQGQRPGGRGETVSPNDGVTFSFFDTSKTVTQITGLTIAFAGGQQKKHDQPHSPFASFSPPSTLSLPSQGNGVSAGCNVKDCNAGNLSSATVGSTGGDWEITVTFVANGKTFSIDPEMEVKVG